MSSPVENLLGHAPHKQPLIIGEVSLKTNRTPGRGKIAARESRHKRTFSDVSGPWRRVKPPPARHAVARRSPSRRCRAR